MVASNSAAKAFGAFAAFPFGRVWLCCTSRYDRAPFSPKTISSPVATAVQGTVANCEEMSQVQQALVHCTQLGGILRVPFAGCTRGTRPSGIPTSVLGTAPAPIYPFLGPNPYPNAIPILRTRPSGRAVKGGICTPFKVHPEAVPRSIRRGICSLSNWIEGAQSGS